MTSFLCILNTPFFKSSKRDFGALLNRQKQALAISQSTRQYVFHARADPSDLYDNSRELSRPAKLADSVISAQLKVTNWQKNCQLYFHAILVALKTQHMAVCRQI